MSAAMMGIRCGTGARTCQRCCAVEESVRSREDIALNGATGARVCDWCYDVIRFGEPAWMTRLLAGDADWEQSVRQEGR